MEVAQEIRRLSAREGGLPEGAGPEGPRRRILEAALGLFAEVGFAGASIRDIATAAGIRSATLYAHYPAKEQILADLVRIGHENHYERLRAASGLAELVRAHVQWHAEHPRLAVVVNAELHALSPDLAAPVLEIRDASTQLLLDAAGGDWLAAAAIGGMGIRVANWFVPGGEYTVDEVADTYATFALRMVGGDQ
ncbi:MAG TPA: TetR/AcrR family transcriptional regulator [Acidimicrobiales bacterium]|nr:TetR/AcrR family transcriptional regulator [Acidimicrobiales bacterium]